MFPLFIKDQNAIVSIAYTCAFFACIDASFLYSFKFSFYSIAFIIPIITILYYFFSPPSRYPDLHSVLISSYSCFIFCLFYCIMLYKQYQLSQKKLDYSCLFQTIQTIRTFWLDFQTPQIVF